MIKYILKIHFQGIVMSKANEYYFNLLNKEQQKAYYAMKEGLLKLKDSFQVPLERRIPYKGCT